MMDRKNRQMRSILSKFNTRSDDGKMFIEGYFSVFNSPYELWDDVTEEVAQGAFDETLSEDIRCLIDHETRLVLGRNKSGTLELKTDARGLWGKVEINHNDQDAVNLYERVKRGDVDQCSFGFEILDEEFIDNGDGTAKWIIRKVKLYEVSIVTFPAYEETSVSARKKDIETINKRKITTFKSNLIRKLKGDK